MRNKLLKLGSAALCFTLAAAVMAACFGGGAAALQEGIDFYLYKLDAGTRVKMTAEKGEGDYDGWFVLNAEADGGQIGMDVKEFFDAEEVLHDEFEITVRRGVDTVTLTDMDIKGDAWVQVTSDPDPAKCTYKKYGAADSTAVVRGEITSPLVLYVIPDSFYEVYFNLPTADAGKTKNFELTFKGAEKNHVVKVSMRLTAAEGSVE